MDETLKKILFLLFISIMNSLTANFVHIIDFAGHEAYQIFLFSTATIIIFNSFYYKLYLVFLNKSKVTLGLLYSSIVGASLAIILSFINFISKINVENVNNRIYNSVAFLIIVYAISAIILFFIDSQKTNSDSKLKIFLLSFTFYASNFIFCIFLFTFYLIIIGGW